MKLSYVLMSVLVALMMGVSGCDSVGEQPTTADGGNGSSSVGVDLTEVDKATTEAEVSLDEIYAEIDDIDLGGFDFVDTSSAAKVSSAVGTSNVDAQGGLSSISKKIIKGLDKVVTKFEKIVGKLHDKLNDARTKILQQMAKLDATNPAHVGLIAQLQKLMAKVDDIEARLDEALDELSEKVGGLSDRVDKLISKLDMGNPLHWIVAAELNKIRIYLAEVQDRLAAL